MKSFTFHSYKGGTGKTFMSMNLAILYAKKGKKVCLLDFDFRAPSIHSFFDTPRPKFTLNELVDGQCDVDVAISDTTKELDLPGQLYVGFADSSTEGISGMAAKDRKWQMRSLRLINKSMQILSEKFEMDYVIFDTSPGFQYSSINAVLSSDVAVLVTTPDRADVAGTLQLIEGVYEALERKTGIILNKIPTGVPSVGIPPQTIEKFSSIFSLPIIEAVPCSCDVMSLFGESIFMKEQEAHPVLKTLVSASEKLERF